MRASTPFLLLALPALGALGCGSEEATPAACLSGPDAYVAAVRSVPREAKLSGTVPISECLRVDQEGGELASVGGSMVSAAIELNAAARAEPNGAASFGLGFLVGAAERGAEQTGGIHAELIRRLRAAALYSPGGNPFPPRFRHAFREGLAAGRAGG